MVKSAMILVILASFFTLQLSPVSAQVGPTKEEKKTQRIKEKIRSLGTGEKVKIKVKLYNKTTYQGHVGQSDEDSFSVVDPVGKSTTVQYSAVDSIGGKNLSTGAKIAIGIGIGAGATLAILFAIVAALD